MNVLSLSDVFRIFSKENSKDLTLTYKKISATVCPVPINNLKGNLEIYSLFKIKSSY